MSVAKITTGPILLTGATGQVGNELLSTLSSLGEVIAPPRSTLDLANIQSIGDTVRTLRPHWIVNPAAYTAVDKAESEPDLAYAINHDAVRAIGEEARTIGAGVIHFSTDYVFDGTGTTPYVETDPTNPVSVYGASKLAGEQALAQSGAAHLIFRTSWVYGSRGKNFLLTILKLAREREHLRVVGDQHGAPTWSRDLAQLTAHVISQVEGSMALKGRDFSRADDAHPVARLQPLRESFDRATDLPAALAQFQGIYHAAGAGETTWHGFAAEAIRQQREREPNTRFAEIEAITTAEYPTPARRPANSRMNCAKLEQRFNWRMPDWRESLGKVLAEL